MSSFSLLRAATVGALAVAVLLPTHAAQASETQLSIMQDDDALIYSGDAARDAALKRMKTLGADAVRVTVLWSVVADGIDTKPKNKKEKAAVKKAMANFKKYGADNPKAYPRGNWDKYDRLDRACKTVGLICYFDVTGPGPSYAMTKPPAKFKKDAAFWKPKPSQFYSFVQAVGKRFDGKYKDENDGRVTLPAIRFWGIWNEPNQGGWLRPQFLNGKPYSPSIYRRLFTYGLRALKSTGHDPNATGDIVLMGETAPLNSGRKTTTSGMGPRTFINELFCGPGSDGLGCGDFAKTGPLQATAWAHHPYTKKLSPLQVDPDPSAITMANFADLGTQLDSLAPTGHIATGMPLISTEYGYETNPPDPTVTVNFDQQAAFLQLGDYITEQNPRVIGNTQFLLYDSKPNKRYKAGSRNYWGTYQSGLYNSNGKVPKKAATTYPFPFLAIPGAKTPEGFPVIEAWGQLRFLADIPAGQSQTITLEYSPDNVTYAPVGPITVTSVKGFFDAKGITLPGPGYVRVTYATPMGSRSSQPQVVN